MSEETVNHAVKKRDRVEKKVPETAESINETTNHFVEQAEELAEAAVETIQKAAEKAKDAASEVLESVNTHTKDIAAEAKKELDAFNKKAKDASESYSEKIVEELKDPAVSTTVLFTAVTASAASTYLTQQHKQGKLTAFVTAGVVIGVAALSAAEYFSIKAYFKRNSTS